MFKLDLENVEEPEIKLQHPLDHRKNKRVPEKTSISALLTVPKPLTVWITKNCGKFLKMGIPDYLTFLLRNLHAGQESTELDMEQKTGSKSGEEQVKAVHCHPTYLTYMQSIS